MLEGIAKLESSGLRVKDVVVFIDHGGDHDRHAKERLAAAGYRAHAVLGIEQITRVLLAAGRLSAEQAARLVPPAPVAQATPEAARSAGRSGSPVG